MKIESIGIGAMPSVRSTRRRLRLLALACVPLFGCSAPLDGDDLAREVSALNVCDETVPENRSVDGIPAYAQCDATTDASIWSNDGIDTSTTQVGPDWVRTQRGGGYQCTELAYRYMYFRWGVDYRSGNAEEWCDGALPSNLVISTTPVHGDLIVFAGGTCGADPSTGHIAVVDTVDAASSRVTIVEENRAGRRSTDQSCATCFLHAVDNDGTSGGAAGTGAGGAGPGGGGGAGNAAGAGPGGGGAGEARGGAGFGGMGPGTSGSAGVPMMAGSGGNLPPAGAGGGPGGTAGTIPGGSGGAPSNGAAGAGVGPGTGGEGTSGTGGASGDGNSPAVEASELESAGCGVARSGRPRTGAVEALLLACVAAAFRRRKGLTAGTR